MEALHPADKGGKTIPTLGGEQQVGFASDTAAVSGESKRAINQHLARADVLERITGKEETGSVAGLLAARQWNPIPVRGRPLAVWRWPDTGARGMGKNMGRKAKAARKPLVC